MEVYEKTRETPNIAPQRVGFLGPQDGTPNFGNPTFVAASSHDRSTSPKLAPEKSRSEERRTKAWVTSFSWQSYEEAASIMADLSRWITSLLPEELRVRKRKGDFSVTLGVRVGSP